MAGPNDKTGGGQASSVERRRYIRTEISVPITLHIQSSEFIEGVKAVTQNISATGMMFETDRKLPTGTDVKIDIHTPKGGNAVHCAGRVIWSTQTSDSLKYYNGIEFTNIEEDNKNTFLRFLCDAIYKSGINR